MDALSFAISSHHSILDAISIASVNSRFPSGHDQDTWIVA